MLSRNHCSPLAQPLARFAATAFAVALALAFGLCAATALGHEGEGHHSGDSHHCSSGSCCHDVYDNSVDGPTRSCRSYDLTSDKKCDTVKFTCTSYQGGTFDDLKIYVNGKLKRTLHGCGDHNTFANAEMITLGNGKTYLHVCCGNEAGCTDQLLRYKGGELKVICSNKTIKCGDGPCHISCVPSGNTVKVTFTPHNYCLGDGFSCTYAFKYSDGTLKRTSSYSTDIAYCALGDDGSSHGIGKPTITAGRSFTVYAKSTCKTKKFTCKAGTKLRVDKVRICNGYLRYHVKTSSGKTGWMKNRTSPYKAGCDTRFEECHQAA